MTRCITTKLGWAYVGVLQVLVAFFTNHHLYIVSKCKLIVRKTKECKYYTNTTFFLIEEKIICIEIIYYFIFEFLK